VSRPASASTPIVPDDERGVAAAVSVLDAAGIVAIPTDTVYGIACRIDAPGGIERLFAAKDRPPDRAIMVLVDELDQVAPLVEVTAAAEALRGLWPGGLTLVLPLRPGAAPPAALTAGTRTLGVRVPDHATPRALARAVGPLPTTSANPSGEPEARSAADVAARLAGRLDLILDGGESRGGVPSTVVDCGADRPRVLRAGAIAVERIAAALEAAGIDHEVGP
jgi:L-threonylcarbamoyladenylate synthase